MKAEGWMTPGAGGPADTGGDARLRGRLAEIMAAAGVPQGQVALQVLYLLPDGFIKAYEDLFHRAWKGADGSAIGVSGGQRDAGELGIAPRKSGTLLGTGGQGKGGGSSGAGGKRAEEGEVGGVQSGAKKFGASRRSPLGDEEAMEIKREVDRRLRALGRDIRRGTVLEKGTTGEVARCEGCARFMGVGWNFCANCGRMKTVAGD